MTKPPAVSALPLAQALLRCPSITPEDHGALDVLQKALEQLSFQCWRLPFDGDDGAKTDNLFARLGTASPHLCFAGHTDVVPVGDHLAWKCDPFEALIEGEYLYGRGTEDMKCAIACFVAAVAELLQNKKPAGSLSFLITGDEEGFAINGTKKVLQWMEANGHIPDACLVGEPTNPTHIGEMVKIGRRGSVNFELIIKGKQGHAAYPHLADNPVTPLIKILHALKNTPLDKGTDFFPQSNLEVVSIDVGNPAYNVIPSEARAKFNIRFNDLHTSGGLATHVKEKCNAITKDYELNVKVTGEAFVTKPGPLSDMIVSAVKTVTGHAATISTTGGTSDARFIHHYCPVVEFGATGVTPHMVNERIKLSDIDLLTKCYAEFLQRYFA